jgi:hypothetical protein
MRPVFLPDEANTKLVIDPNAVLPSSVALESFQSIPRRLFQIIQVRREMNLIELPQSDFGNIRKVSMLPPNK